MGPPEMRGGDKGNEAQRIESSVRRAESLVALLKARGAAQLAQGELQRPDQHLTPIEPMLASGPSGRRRLVQRVLVQRTDPPTRSETEAQSNGHRTRPKRVGCRHQHTTLA